MTHTQYNDSRSSWADVASGIPQGSVLGPMLFICYINDMPSSVLSSIYLFADDAKLYRNISSDDDPPPPPHRTPARPSATGEMVREMAATFQLKQTCVRSCTSVNKTPIETTPWAEQRWLQVQQPARRTLACTSIQS